MKNAYKLFGLTVPVIAACSSGQTDALIPRPNVLFILIDDMGYGDLSCNGNPVYSTPNIDRLHDQSVVFTQFHSAPMSTPTRGQLMTGCEALRNGASWVGTSATHLRTDIPTMPEIFRNAGYSTALFGKWHLGDNFPLRPQDRGFDHTLTFPQQEVGTVNDYWTNDYFDDNYIENGIRKDFKGFCTDVWFSEAIKWIDTVKDDGNPFFCYIATNVTHGPQFAPAGYTEKVRETYPDLKGLKTNFVATVLNLDDNIGRMLSYIERSGLSENTIVIFMTDNGATMGYSIYNAGMRGLKANLWEGGHRVPWFIRIPGNIPKRINGLAQAEDVFPTLAELCSIDIPDSIHTDGISLAEQITGNMAMPDRILVNQFQRRAEIKKYDACIMWGPWRLVNGIDADPHDSPERKKIYDTRKKEYQINLELYNIDWDPHQDINIIDRYPEVAAKMKSHYDEWWDDISSDTGKHGTIIIGSDAENPTTLCASSWADIYLTQKSDILRGRKAAGYFDVCVAEYGTYRIRLFRWPEESGGRLGDGITVHYTDPVPLGESVTGRALDISSAELKINGELYSVHTGGSDCFAEFNVPMQKGPARIWTGFYDSAGHLLCGAFYVEVMKTN